jgi:hypothetical protein
MERGSSKATGSLTVTVATLAPMESMLPMSGAAPGITSGRTNLTAQTASHALLGTNTRQCATGHHLMIRVRYAQCVRGFITYHHIGTPPPCAWSAHAQSAWMDQQTCVQFTDTRPISRAAEQSHSMR